MIPESLQAALAPRCLSDARRRCNLESQRLRQWLLVHHQILPGLRVSLPLQGWQLDQHRDREFVPCLNRSILNVPSME